MSSINTSYSNQYYQLASQQQNAQTTAASTTQPKTLADILASSDDTNANDSNNAYLLDLSPEAQAYMNANATSTSSDSDSNASFTLSAAQQTKLNVILDKYKDLPPTQDNYNKMQDDLKAAGLSPDQLKAQDEIRSFNSTDLLIEELNGTAPSVDDTQSQTTSDEDTKSTNYMQQILSAWTSSSSSTNSADNA